MLRITYTRYCDACGAEGVSEEMRLHTTPSIVFPQPPEPMWAGNLDLCEECATPVKAALDGVFQAAADKRRG